MNPPQKKASAAPQEHQEHQEQEQEQQGNDEMIVERKDATEDSDNDANNHNHNHNQNSTNFGTGESEELSSSSSAAAVATLLLPLVPQESERITLLRNPSMIQKSNQILELTRVNTNEQEEVAAAAAAAAADMRMSPKIGGEQQLVPRRLGGAVVDGTDNDDHDREEERAAVGNKDGSDELLTLLTRPSMVVKSNQILEWTNHVHDDDDDVTKDASESHNRHAILNDDPGDCPKDNPMKILEGVVVVETETTPLNPSVIPKLKSSSNTAVGMEPVVDDTDTDTTHHIEKDGLNGERTTMMMMTDLLARPSVIVRSNQILELTDRQHDDDHDDVDVDDDGLQQEVLGDDSDDLISTTDLQERKELVDSVTAIQLSFGKCLVHYIGDTNEISNSNSPLRFSSCPLLPRLPLGYR
jgi:hypothetical protein